MIVLSKNDKKILLHILVVWTSVFIHIIIFYFLTIKSNIPSKPLLKTPIQAKLVKQNIRTLQPLDNTKTIPSNSQQIENTSKISISEENKRILLNKNELIATKNKLQFNTQNKNKKQIEKITDKLNIDELYNINNIQNNNISNDYISNNKPMIKNIKHLLIHENMKDYKYISYLESWKQKVERIGQLNYPAEAKTDIFNTLVLSVILNSDGTIKNMTIKRSSGNKNIDDAAKNIVNLSAPFSPFTETMKNEVDAIEIIRTWNFKKDNLHL